MTWQLGEVIGRGASGTTYVAQHGDGREAVAEVLRVAEAQDWKTIELFEREARVLEALRHPSIPRYIEHRVEEDGARLVLMMVDVGSVQASLAQSTVMTAVGTFGFMAPEQVRGATVPASDLYGLGVSLLCAATGFTREALPTNHRTGGSDLWGVAVPSELRDVLESMVEPSLDHRFDSADAALRELTLPVAPVVPEPAVADDP